MFEGVVYAGATAVELHALQAKDISDCTADDIFDTYLPAVSQAYKDCGHAHRKYFANQVVHASIPTICNLADGPMQEQPGPAAVTADAELHKKMLACLHKLWVREHVWHHDFATWCQQQPTGPDDTHCPDMPCCWQEHHDSVHFAAELLQRSDLQFLHKLMNCLWHKRQGVAQQVSCGHTSAVEKACGTIAKYQVWHSHQGCNNPVKVLV